METFPKNLMIIEFDVGMQQKVAMFNSTVIPETEVRYFIEKGILTDEYFPNVVIMTKRQYLNLFDKPQETKAAISKEDRFYSELIMEQREQG